VIRSLVFFSRFLHSRGREEIDPGWLQFFWASGVCRREFLGEKKVWCWRGQVSELQPDFRRFFSSKGGGCNCGFGLRLEQSAIARKEVVD